MTRSGNSGGNSDRTRRYRVVTAFQRRTSNPLAKRLVRFLPGQAVLETVGRRTGRPRRTPIGGKLDGSTFWFVSEFGRQSQYVRNLMAEPRVRLRIGRTWRSGVASVVEDDDVRARLRKLGGPNSFMVRLVGNELRTIRIDLD